jgi:hypothetical protein
MTKADAPAELVVQRLDQDRRRRPHARRDEQRHEGAPATIQP